MIDYYALVADAVANLGDQNSAERRRDLYDRGRKLILTRIRENGAVDQATLDREMASYQEACQTVEARFAPDAVTDDFHQKLKSKRPGYGHISVAVVATIAILMIISGGAYWLWRPRTEPLAGLTAMAQLYSRATPALAGIPGVNENLLGMLERIATEGATNSGNAQALALLKSGKPADAEPLLKAVADDKAKQSDRNAVEAATAYLNLALVAAVSDAGRAKTYFAQVISLDPSNLEGLMLSGWYSDPDELEAAKADFARVVALAKPGDDDKVVMAARLGMGLIQKHSGDLAGAWASYQACQVIAERLEKSDPGNDDWQRELSVSLVSLAEDYRKAQQPAKAREAFTAGRSIVVRQVAKSPEDKELKEALSWYDAQIAALNNLK